MRIVSFITDPAVIRKILEHLGRWDYLARISRSLQEFIKFTGISVFNSPLKNGLCAAHGRAAEFRRL